MAFPDERDRHLIRDARRAVQFSADIGDWMADFSSARQERQLGEISPLEEAEVLRLRREARNLLGSARVPVAAAVYGASQVGKSLFVGRVTQPADPEVSPLGREATTPPAYYDRLDFIQDLNPNLGEKEATALVTRFTTKDRIDPSLPPDFAVVVKALTRAEWLKVLARGFKAECRRKDDDLVWDEPTLRDAFERAYQAHPATQADAGWRVDLHETYVYMRSHYNKDFTAGEVEFNGLLSTFRLAPKGYEQLAAAIFWDEWQDLTELFRDVNALLDSIHQTGRPGIACHWAGVRFLLDSQLSAAHENPHSKHFPKVDWSDFVLQHDGASGWWCLDHSPGSPSGGKMPAHRLQAAMLELVVPVLPDRLTPSWEKVLGEIDVLDVPGMRAERVDEAGKRAKADRIEERMEIVKRGKVLYLFERYIEELQVQTLLLLVRYGNLEVKDQIKKNVDLWGQARYGEKAWPRGASVESPALFLGMTGIDHEFRNKRVVTDDEFQKLYDARIETLRDTLDAGVMDEFGGRRFTNVYPLRYPGSWDTTLAERQKAGEVEKWDRAGKAFLRSEQIKNYVAGAEAKWRAAMDDLDGGVASISAAMLAGTGTAGKQDFLKARIAAVESRLLQMGRGWAVDPDANLGRDKRVRVAEEVLAWLGEDEHAIYHRARALKESLCLEEGDIKPLADVVDTQPGPARNRIIPLRQSFPALLREFLNGWARVTTPQRWEKFTKDHPAGGPWPRPEVVHALALYLVEYLHTEAVFPVLVDRLLDVVSLRLRDEAAARAARRKYVLLVLNDFLINPGPDAPAVEVEPEANGHDFGLMAPFLAQWRSRLPECLASAAGNEVRVPPGNDELIGLLKRYEGP